MKRGFLVAAVVAADWAAAAATPAWAHGDHDARPLARDLAAGPYIVSLWQVYPDAGEALAPYLIVTIDGAAVSVTVDVDVAVNSTPVEVRRSTTTPNAWETTEGLVEGDAVTVTIADGTQTWQLDPVVVPPAPTAMLPMRELLYAAIVLTVGTAWWVARRTARAWRRPVLRAGEAAPAAVGGSGPR